MSHLCLLGHAPSIHLQRWALAMRERGFRVSVISAAPVELPGIELHLLPEAPHLGWAGRVLACRARVAELQPDLVHGHYLSSYGALAALSGRRPLVLTAWGSDVLVSPRESRLMRTLTGWMLRRADLITADSRDVVEAIRGYGPRAAVHEVLWGADIERFRPAPLREPSAPWQIASLRAWQPNYRIEVLIDALALLAPRFPVRLNLFGCGPLEPDLRAQVTRLGLDEQVVWHGQLAAEQLAERVAACDVAVSVPRSDATSVALLEAMACGLPAVVSDLPANRQWVDAQGGLCVDGGSAAAIAQALASLQAEPLRAAAMGRRNRALIESQGSSASQMDRMAGLYRNLLAGAR